MDVKILIGQRIAEARKKIGLSQIELSDITGFGKTRVSNWETGFRTPKLEDAKILEKVLNVPAPYLLCLSDIKEFPADFGVRNVPFKSIPLFTESDLVKIDQLVQLEIYNTLNYLPLVSSVEEHIGQGFYSFQLFDDSMSPDFNLIVFNPYAKVRHNDLILVKILGSDEILFRKYFIDNSEIGKPLIKLIPINNEWIATNINDQSNLLILGVMSSVQRIFT